MPQLINVKSVSVPSIGKLPLADKAGSFVPSSTKREHKAGRMAEDGGFTEHSSPAVAELSLNLTGGIDIDAINAITDEEVIVRLSDGSKYLMMQASRTGDPVKAEDGTSKLTLTANRSEKI